MLGRLRLGLRCVYISVCWYIIVLVYISNAITLKQFYPLCVEPMFLKIDPRIRKLWQIEAAFYFIFLVHTGKHPNAFLLNTSLQD